MKKAIIVVVTLIFLVGFILFFALGLNNRPDILPSQLKGKTVPEFTATKLDAPDRIKTILTNEDFKGPALINVWATWCPTCRDEHSTLNVLKKEGVTIYGINYKDDPKKAYAWLQELGNPYEFNVEDPSGSIGIDMGVYGAPETFFIDANNVIRYRHVGAILPQIWNQELKAIYNDLFTFDREGAEK